MTAIGKWFHIVHSEESVHPIALIRFIESRYGAIQTFRGMHGWFTAYVPAPASLDGRGSPCEITFEGKRPEVPEWEHAIGWDYAHAGMEETTIDDVLADIERMREWVKRDGRHLVRIRAELIAYVEVPCEDLDCWTDQDTVDADLVQRIREQGTIDLRSYSSD